MLLRAIFSLATVSAASVVSIPESDFFPVVEYWRSNDFQANQLCQDAVTQADAPEYPARASSGLRQLATQMKETFAASGLTSTKDLEYLAAQRRKGSSWPTIMTSSMSIAVAAGRTGASVKGFGGGMCSLFNGVSPNDWCYNLGNFSQSTQCLSDYAYQDDSAVLQSLSPKSDYGWSGVPDSCLKPISVGKFPVDLGIQRYSSTPDVIDASVARAESQVYYMALKALDHFERFTEQQYLTAVGQAREGASGSRVLPDRRAGNVASGTATGGRVGIHDLFKNTDVFEEILPEWKVEKLFMINEPRFLDSGKTLRLPYAAMASKNNDLLFVLGSPHTTYESRLALYNQLSFKYLYNFTGEVHDGGSTIFQTMSGIVEFAIDRFYNAADLSTQTGPVQITFVAKDLPGSAGAVILASHIQRVLSEKFGSSRAVRVNAITFGTPYLGDQSFAEKVKDVIEVRNVNFVEDSTDVFPCATTYSCDERVLLPRTGIETGKEYRYYKVPGRVELSISDLVQFDPVWGSDTSPLEIAAIKDCAYHCYFSQTVCVVDPDDRCHPSNCPSFARSS